MSIAPERQEQFKIFCLALLCGLRKREIDTLLWRSVDFDKAVIRIERTEHFQSKSEESASEIDLAPELVEILRTFHSCAKGEFVIESDNPPRYHLIPNLLDNQISGSVFSRRAALSGRVAIEDSAAAFRLALPKNPIAIGPIISKIWYKSCQLSCRARVLGTVCLARQ